MTRAIAAQAYVAMSKDALERLAWRHRFVLRHRRFFPASILTRSFIAFSDARIDAEMALPRRYRRSLRGERMLPAKEKP